MIYRNRRVLIIPGGLIVFSLACNAISGAAPQEPTEPTPVSLEITKPTAPSSPQPEIIPTEHEADAPTGYESDFPLPGAVVAIYIFRDIRVSLRFLDGQVRSRLTWLLFL